jgi:hypothetical protein
MRRIQLFTRIGLSAITSVARKAKAVALTAGLMVAVGASQSQAQYSVPYAASNSSASKGLANTGTVFGSPVMKLGDAAVTAGSRSAVVDSAFRGTTKNSSVKPASYILDEGYAALNMAESCHGYGPDASANINWYFRGEALVFRREGNRRFSLTQNVFMNNYDFEFGGRFTGGRMLDRVNAFEFVYVGPFRWTKTSDVTGVGTINSRFLANPASLDDAFNGANRHVQVLQADLDNFEVNRRYWAWDAISTMVGIRYVKYEENYQLASNRGAAPLAGSYRDRIENDMIGVQVGGDVFFPTSLRTLVSIKGKGGVFANLASRELRMVDTDGQAVINGFDDVDIAGLIELGANAHYDLTPSIRLSGGYELWFLPGVATQSNQRPQFLNANSGSTIRMDDDIVFHGATFGAQLLY